MQRERAYCCVTGGIDGVDWDVGGVGGEGGVDGDGGDDHVGGARGKRHQRSVLCCSVWMTTSVD